MAYDKNKDVEVLKMTFEQEPGKSVIFTVNVYDNGAPKIGMVRCFEDEDGKIKYGKMGRMTFHESEYFVNEFYPKAKEAAKKAVGK